MNKNAELKLRRLTQNQAKALSAIMSVPGTTGINPTVSGVYISNATGLRGNALGGTVSALERNGTIQPLGREGRQFNWELTDPDIKQAIQEEPDTLMDMVNRIAEGKKK